MESVRPSEAKIEMSSSLATKNQFFANIVKSNGFKA